MRAAAEEKIPGGVFAPLPGYLSFVRVSVHTAVEFAGNQTLTFSKMPRNKSQQLDSSSTADPIPILRTFQLKLQSLQP